MNNIISSSGFAIQKMKNSDVFLVAANGIITQDFPHFIISGDMWQEAQNNVANKGINGLNGISGICINLSIACDRVDVTQQNIKMTLTPENVDAFCEAMSLAKYNTENLPEELTAFE